MFSTLGLFKNIPCPAPTDCSVSGCLFSHDLQPETPLTSKEPPAKKQKLDDPNLIRGAPKSRDKMGSNMFSILRQDDSGDDRSSESSSKEEDTTHASTIKPSLQLQIASRKTTEHGKSSVMSARSTSTAGALGLPASVEASNTASGIQSAKATTSLKKEPLQPRSMTKPPATHPVRFKLLLLVHEQIARLNKLIAGSVDVATRKFALSEEDIIKMALDEEHSNAKDNPKVYANVMKNRIGSLRKMDLQPWIAERKAALQNRTSEQQKMEKNKLTINKQRITTGLSYDQEIQILSQLVAPIEALSKHGYVTSAPNEIELNKARAGVEAAKGWEICDRCGCRFRAYSTRQADGAITTGGSCRHHWGRLGPQPRSTGAKPVYSCCKLEQGQPGCDEKPSHVFKISNSQRLATILQFESSPDVVSEEVTQPVSFDCEMAYTSYGMELIRLTAASWPSGDPLLDILVRPKGEVLDLNTRFSGVSIDQWTQAQTWHSLDLPKPPNSHAAKSSKEDQPAAVSTYQTAEKKKSALPIVASPEHARSLFFKLINPKTPLIGHALENDLIAIRIVHPTIIDTVILYPHRVGLPYRNKLKFLVRDEIQWTIQEGGSDGHDSLEDALAAGELVRHKVRTKWEVLRSAGWIFNGNQLQQPNS